MGLIFLLNCYTFFAFLTWHFKNVKFWKSWKHILEQWSRWGNVTLMHMVQSWTDAESCWCWALQFILLRPQSRSRDTDTKVVRSECQGLRLGLEFLKKVLTTTLMCASELCAAEWWCVDAEFYNRVEEDISTGFGGLQGRGAKRQDAAIERELVLSLEEVFHSCTKKMKISRRVWFSHFTPVICNPQHRTGRIFTRAVA